MTASDDLLWGEVSDLLGSRPGWSVQDSPTPGAGPNWSFAPHGKVHFSVYADGGVIYLYEEKTDQEVRFATVEDLRAGLDANPTTAARPDEPRRPFMSWG